MLTYPIHVTALIVVALADAVGGFFHGSAFRASQPPLESLARFLRPVILGLFLHYSFWYGWMLPAFSAPGQSDTGGVLLGMLTLIVEPAACTLVVLMLESALWLRHQTRALPRLSGS
jgi:hypothetical protein